MVSTDKLAGAFPTTPWVNQAGVPRTDLGTMQYASVFGPQPIVHGRRAECGLLQCCRVGRPERSQSESDRPNGYVNTLFKYMPPVNNFDIGDG